MRRHYIQDVPDVCASDGLVHVDFKCEDVHTALRPHVALAYAERLTKAAGDAIASADVVGLPGRH